MLESLRPADYLLYRDAAAAIFSRHDGEAAIDTFGLADLVGTESLACDLSAAFAFLEAQGACGAVTSALGRLGLTGLGEFLVGHPTPEPLVLGFLIGTGRRLAVPGLPATASAAVDLPGSGMVLLEGAPNVPFGATGTDGYLTVVDVDAVSRLVLIPEKQMSDLRPAIVSRVQLGAAAELLGLCDRILSDALSYVKLRQQFGRPVGDFQAMQHLLAWAATERHQLTCLFDISVGRAARGDIDPTLSEAVKAMAGRAVHAIVQAATQATGAISFTWEHPLNRLHRRALGLDQLAGPSADLIAAMGRRLRTEGALPELFGLATDG